MSDPYPFGRPDPQAPQPERPVGQPPYSPPGPSPYAPPAWNPAQRGTEPDPTLTQPVAPAPWPAPVQPAPYTTAPALELPAPSARRRTRGRSQERGRFWLGFVLGFVLLSIASCGSMALALGFGDLRLSDIRGRGEVWTPPTLVPTPTVDPAAPQAATVADGRFVTGETVRNVTGSRVNVRATPGHLGKSDGDVLAQLEPGGAMIILGETAPANNLTWWRVSYQGVEGWVAEATASGVQILGE